MKTLLSFPLLRTVVLVAFLLPISAVLTAQVADSPEINKLLNSARDHATLAYDDSADLQSYVRSHMSWESCARCLQRIKDHANDLTKDYNKLQDLKPQGSSWQKETIDRLEPQLRAMAKNLNDMIEHLNHNQSQAYMPTMREFARTNLVQMEKARQIINESLDRENTK